MPQHLINSIRTCSTTMANPSKGGDAKQKGLTLNNQPGQPATESRWHLLNPDRMAWKQLLSPTVGFVFTRRRGLARENTGAEGGGLHSLEWGV